MKFRFTEKWNKNIVNNSLRRKISPKKIIKKNTFFRKKKVKTSLTSSLWSAFCPTKKESQAKKFLPIKKSYELRSNKKKFKNKSAEAYRRKKKEERKKFNLKFQRNRTNQGTYAEVLKRSSSNLNKPQKVTNRGRMFYSDYRYKNRKRHEYKSPEQKMEERIRQVNKERRERRLRRRRRREKRKKEHKDKIKMFYKKY